MTSARFATKLTFKSALMGLLVCCFSAKIYANPTSYMLQIELSPAVCKIDSTQKRTRQCLEGYSLNVRGLYPQGATKSCQTSNVLNLTPVQNRVLMRIMPDENHQAKLWRNVGGCVSMNANQYFRLVTSYAERLKVPEEISTQTDLRVGRDWLEKKFMTLNSGMPTQSLVLACAAGPKRGSILLTSIQVCYKTNGRYTNCQTQTKDTCPTHFLIQGSY